MSLLKPVININPTWATNGLDNSAAGWYQVSPASSNLALRVSSSNIGLTGEIQFTSNNGSLVFQGYDGLSWQDFNATQGAQGVPGLDFTNAVNFNNLGANASPGVEVVLGEVFSTTYANVAAALSNVNIRTIAGGSHMVNSNLTVQSLVVSQNSNVITLTSAPLPFEWDFTGSNSQVSYLKNAAGDMMNYGWGDVSKWTVKQGQTVVKGQAVRLDSESGGSSNVVITPITYTILTSVTPYNAPMNMLGVALNDASGGDTCEVCTHGVTTVLCTNSIPTGFSATTNVVGVGIDGIVGKDGGIFCITQPPVIVNYYIRAGYFLESGGTLATVGNYALFYVEPRVVNT